MLILIQIAVQIYTNKKIERKKTMKRSKQKSKIWWVKGVLITRDPDGMERERW